MSIWTNNDEYNYSDRWKTPKALVGDGKKKPDASINKKPLTLLGTDREKSQKLLLGRKKKPPGQYLREKTE